MVITRFSPSPTGLVHLGNARTALFSALYALREKGHFILRIEDTDVARSDDKYTEMLLADLRWLGIKWQEGPEVGGAHAPYWQSQRHHIYANYYQQLEALGRAYPCFCTDQELALTRKLQLSRGQPPRYAGTCRHLSKEEVAARIHAGKKPALRFHVLANSQIEFVDLVKGPQRFSSADIGDFIIRRAEGTASFMFCNAIDDSLMEVTHVIRGEDHLTNTPRQLLILEALKMRAPHYAHLSMIMGDDGAPLSKRHGSFSLNDLMQQGYLPKAVLNYLARLSHHYDDQHLLTREALAAHFHLEKLSRAPARFDQNQLLHWQKETVMSLDVEAMWQWLGDDIRKKIPSSKQDLFIEVMRQNSLFPEDAFRWTAILFENEYQFTAENSAILKEAGEAFFIEAQALIKIHQTQLPTILDALKTKLAISGKRLFMPLRIALTGEQHGPELIHIANLLGAEQMILRLYSALEEVRK